MRAVMGLLPASASVSGAVCWKGIDLLAAGEESMRQRRWREIGIVVQNAMNALNPVQTIGSQIAEPLVLHGLATASAARRHAADLLGLVGRGCASCWTFTTSYRSTPRWPSSTAFSPTSFARPGETLGRAGGIC